MTERTPTADWRIYDTFDNGEFLTFCKLDLILDGKLVETLDFTGTTEEPPGHHAHDLATSHAVAWYETVTQPIEDRLGPFGTEWMREQEERYGNPFS